MDIQQLAEKLQQDGIERGKQQADEIIDEANKKAEEIIAAAKAKQQEIINNAKQEGESLLENSKQSLRLAARDVLLKLQQDIAQIMQTIVSKEANKALVKEDILKSLLQTLVSSYQKESSHLLKLEIPKETGSGVKQWLADELKAEVTENKQLSGFRLQEQDGGQIEVTSDSVREALLPFLSGIVEELVTQEKPS